MKRDEALVVIAHERCLEAADKTSEEFLLTPLSEESIMVKYNFLAFCRPPTADILVLLGDNKDAEYIWH